MAFRSIEEIDSWAEQKGGVDAVRTSQARGDWSDARSVNLVEEWLRREGERRAGAERQSADGLARRTTEATELAASAAVDSARHAKDSARWAKWAVIVALAALFVSAWPAFDLLRRIVK
jgi:hypothetical protein